MLFFSLLTLYYKCFPMLLYNLADIKERGNVGFGKGIRQKPSVTPNKRMDCDRHLWGPKSSLNCWDFGWEYRRHS